MTRQHRTHGTGEFEPAQFRKIGDNVVFEPGVLVFHPENIELGTNIYVGHNVILKGYYKGGMRIGDNSWIGQGCYFFSGGPVDIGRNVGIGPFVKILTGYHVDQGIETPILFSPLTFEPVSIGEDSDIGIGSIILPGVSIGRGVQIGAGSLVTKDIPDYAIAYGSPAQVTRFRN